MKRPPGRPPLDATDRSVSVSVRMPSKQYDQTYRLAQHDRITIAALIRRALQRDAEKKTQK